MANSNDLAKNKNKTVSKHKGKKQKQSMQQKLNYQIGESDHLKGPQTWLVIVVAPASASTPYVIQLGYACTCASHNFTLITASGSLYKINGDLLLFLSYISIHSEKSQLYSAV